MNNKNLLNLKWSYIGSYDPSIITWSNSFLLNKIFTQKLFAVCKFASKVVYLRLFKKNQLIYQHEFAQELKFFLTSMGPFYIKFGQLLSLKTNIIPEAISTQLQDLQDQVTRIGFEEINEAFVNDFGKPISSVFAEFDKEPFACASIAQVHRAKLLNNNQSVVVKVQKPYLTQFLYIDTFFLHKLINIFKFFNPDIPQNYYQEFIDKISSVVFAELDFMLEAKNLSKFSSNFQYCDYIKIPKIIWNLTGRHVICMENVETKKLDDKLNFRKRKELLQKLLKSYSQQFLSDGFFHADPHLSNFGITEINQLVFYDFGIMGELEENDRLTLIDLIKGIKSINKKQIIEALKKLEFIDEQSKINNLEEIIDKITDAKQKNSFDPKTIKELTKQINLMLTSLKIKPKYYLFVKTIYYLYSSIISNSDLDIELIPLILDNLKQIKT